MIITDRGERRLSSTAVGLTVADLQLTVSPDTTDQAGQTLNCSTSCSLTSVHPTYRWYKNGRRLNRIHGNVFRFTRDDIADSYSCSVGHLNKIRSNAVCVFENNCWSVTYTDRRVCVLEGSSVDFPCTYSYPRGHTVTEVFWHYFRPQVTPEDLSKEQRFAGRVQFIGDKERNCTLRMNDVKKNDYGQYRFRIITDGDTLSGDPGVILDVTDLKVRVSYSPASDGQTVTLICSSSCSLPNNSTYIWYKNGQPVTNKPTRGNKLYLNSMRSEDVLQYSCALGGAEGPEESSVLKLVTVGLVVFLVLMIISAALWRLCVMIRRRGAERDSHIQCVRDSPSDTYSTLNPATMSPDYDCLTSLKPSHIELQRRASAADYENIQRPSR